MTKPTTNMLIPDPDLAAAVREAVNLEPNAPISQEVLQELRKLPADESGISDLTGLEKATNLETLELRGTSVSDVSPLSGLRKLVELDLRGTSVSDVSPLAGLENLKDLMT